MKKQAIITLILVASISTFAQHKPIRIKPNNNGGTTQVVIKLKLFKGFKK